MATKLLSLPKNNTPPMLRATVCLEDGRTAQVEATTREGLYEAASALGEGAVLVAAVTVGAA
jgi:hypothetical protein